MADAIVVTPEMISAGARALYNAIPMDVARPVIPEEEIVETIYLAMRCAETRALPSAKR